MLNIYILMLADYYSGTGGNILIAICIGIVAACIVVGGMIKQLRTAVPKREANDYVKRGSLKLRVNKDHFLYRRTERYQRNQR